MSKESIAIVGAGIGGLVAALALRKVGYKVTVYEQAPRLGDVGAGISLGPNAMHALDYVGVGESVLKRGTVLDGSSVRHYQTNEIATGISIGSAKEVYERFGNYYVMIHRADLHGVLAEAVSQGNPETIELNSKLIDLYQQGTEVVAILESGREVSCNLLIGCDGGKSVVRNKVYDENSPTFAGFVAYRGLVPTTDLNPEYIRTGSTLSIGPDQMFMRYTVRNGSLLNYVGLVATTDWKEEGWNIPSDISETLKHFDGWHEEVVAIIKATPYDQGYKWAILHRPILETFVKGRVALLGDSAHTITPFLGQGAAMSIEDGVLLSRCLGKTDQIDTGLHLYDINRVERANWVLDESRRQADRYMKIDPYNFDLNESRSIHGQIYQYNPVTAALKKA